MIVGFLVLIVFLVTRFPGTAELDLPESITVPNGVKPVAFTQTADWYAVVTEVNEILIFDRETGAHLETILVNVQD